MVPERPYKRQQQLVDAPYQLRFVTRLFMVVLAIAASSSLISSALLWKHMYMPDQGAQITLIVSLIAVATTLLVELLLAIPIIFYLGIKQSHRIVGPVTRIKQALEAIGNGDFSQRITVRKDDALVDVVDAINRMAENLHKRFSRPAS